MSLEQLFHNIDKRLAVIEALSESHNYETAKQLDELRNDMAKIRDEVSKLKIRVAGISASISMVVGFVFKFWSGA